MTTIVNTPLDVPGGVRLALASFTFDSSYPTGGEALTAADYGFDRIIAVLPLGPTTSGLDVRPSDSNAKIQVFNAKAPIRHGQVDGAAAGNVTCTGVAVGDVITKVLAICANVATPAFKYKDITTEFAVCGANTIGNAAGTATVNGCLLVDYYRPSDQEVANTTDLSAESVKLLVVGAVY